MGSGLAGVIQAGCADVKRSLGQSASSGSAPAPQAEQINENESSAKFDP